MSATSTLLAPLRIKVGRIQIARAANAAVLSGENSGMPDLNDIVSFREPPVPEGQSAYVSGAGPSQHIEIVDSNEEWPEQFQLLADRIRCALGWRALVIEHVGSTSVRELPAKPIIDIDLIVADPNDELSYVPALEDVGFGLRVGEPWWFGHRVLRRIDPACHLHVSARAVQKW